MLRMIFALYLMGIVLNNFQKESRSIEQVYKNYCCYVLIIFTFVSTLQPLAVQAATKLADGEYSISFKVLKDTSDEESMMNQYSVSREL